MSVWHRGEPILTWGDLKERLRDCPDETILMNEDGEFLNDISKPEFDDDEEKTVSTLVFVEGCEELDEDEDEIDDDDEDDESEDEDEDEEYEEDDEDDLE